MSRRPAREQTVRRRSNPIPKKVKNTLKYSRPAVEVFDGVLRCIDLLESYSFKDEHVQVALREGEGEAITEAPRGLLRHRYRINRMGVVEAGNIVTPTSHNFSNIEHDLRKLVAFNEGKTRDELRLLCEELVRAYDPCFSCSVH